MNNIYPILLGFLLERNTRYTPQSEEKKDDEDEDEEDEEEY